MPKVNINSRINSGALEDTVILLASYVNQGVNTTSDVTFKSLTTTDDIIVGGNLTVNGNTTIIGTEILQVEDNIVLINSNEAGAGVTTGSGTAGLEIERGSLPNKFFLYQESSNTFRIGDNVLTQALLTRDDSPTSNGIFVWDNTDKKAVSTNTIINDIVFSGSSSSSTTTGAIVADGIGVSGNVYVENNLVVSNIHGDGTLIMNASGMNINSAELLLLNTDSVQIPVNKKLNFASSSDNIYFDGTDLKLTSSGSIITTSTLNNSIVNDSSVVISGSVGILGNTNIYAGVQDYNIFGSSGNLNIRNNTDGTDCVINLSPNDNVALVDCKIKINTISSVLEMGYDSIVNKFVFYNNNTKDISFNSGQLLLKTDGTLTSNSSFTNTGIISTTNSTNSTSSTTGALKVSGGVGIVKDLFVGGIVRVPDTTPATSLTTGSISSAGGLSIQNIFIGDGSNQTYSIITSNTDNLTITGQSSSLDTIVDIVSSSAVNDVFMRITGTSGTDKEYVDFGWDDLLSRFSLTTKKDNSGVVRNLYLTAGSSALLFNTNGTITAESLFIVSGDLQVTGTTNLTGLMTVDNLTVNNVLSLNATTLTYNMTARTTAGPEMFITSSGLFNQSFLSLNSTSVTTSYYSAGSLGSSVNYSRLNMGYDGSVYVINTEIGGTGTDKQIKLYTVGNANQLVLGTDGKVAIATSLNSTSTTGAFTVAGGITSFSSTDASGLSSGGSLTTLGGASIGKSLYVGNEFHVASISDIAPKFLINSSSISFAPAGLSESIHLTGTESTFVLPIILSNNSQTSSTTTGAFTTLGGIGVTKSIYLGQDLIVNGTYKVRDASGLVMEKQTGDFSLTYKSLEGDFLADIKTFYKASSASTMNIGYDITNNNYELILNSTTEEPFVIGSATLPEIIKYNYNGIVEIFNTTASTSTTTGSVILSGGIGVAGNSYYGGTMNISGITSITNSTASSSTSTGALKVSGGLGLAGALFAGGVIQGTSYQIGGTSVLSSTTLGSGITSSSLTSVGTLTGLTSSGAVSITNATASTSTTTGALVVTGGTGIGGRLYVGSSTATTSTTTGALVVTGGVGIGGAVIAGTKLSANVSGTSFGQLHLASGNTNNNIVIEAGTTSDGSVPNAGFSAINFNGYYNGTETRIDTAKNRWRIAVDQRASADDMFFETYNGTTRTQFMTIPSTGIISAGVGTASSSTTTGSLIISGGVGVSTNSYFGGTMNISGVTTITNTDNGSISSGSIITSGGISCAKNLYVGDDIIIGTTDGTQEYIFTDEGAIASILLQSLSSATNFRLNLASADKDGTDNVKLAVYGVGSQISANTEYLDVGYNASSPSFSVKSLITGSGTVRPLIMGTSTNDNLTLNTDGTISASSTTTSSSSSLGAFKIAGGLSINGSTDATSAGIGGGITVAGGVGIGKKLFVGSSTASTSSSTGALVVSGGAGIAGSIYSSGTIITNFTSTSALDIQNTGTVSKFKIDTSADILTTSCNIVISDTTTGGSGTGSITTNGGIYSEKDIYMGSTGNITLTGGTITGLPLPTVNSEAVNKIYVDNMTNGIRAKAPVSVATTADITISSIFTGSVIDGYTLLNGDRVLVKEQTTGTQNGVYIIHDNPTVPTRAADFLVGAEVSNSILYVDVGTVNGNSGFQCTNTYPADVVGTDALVFTKFYSGINFTAGNGLTVSSATLNINTGAGLSISSDLLRLDPSVAGTGLTYTTGILSVNASQTQITSIGTLTTGTWNASTITVPYGGTGATTFNSTSLLIGAGTSAITTNANLVWSSSKLGVGTSTPLGLLDLGTSLVNRKLLLQSGTDNDHQFTGMGANTNVMRFQVSSSSVDNIFYAGTSSTTSQELMRIKGNGSVGIGIDPTSTLHVSGTATITGNTVVSGTFSGGVTTPSVTVTAGTNTSSASTVNTKLIKNGTTCNLFIVVQITSTTANTPSAFTVTLPGRTTNFTNHYDAMINTNGYTTAPLTIQNIASYATSGATTSTCNFQSCNTASTVTYFSMNIVYEAV